MSENEALEYAIKRVEKVLLVKIRLKWNNTNKKKIEFVIGDKIVNSRSASHENRC